MREDLRTIDSFYEAVACDMSLSGMSRSEWKFIEACFEKRIVEALPPFKFPPSLAERLP